MPAKRKTNIAPDLGSRKSTIAMVGITGLLAAGRYPEALLVALFYLGLNALLHVLGKDDVA